MEGVTDLLEWMSGGPNFSPFAPLQSPFQSIVGIVLAIIAIVGLIWMVIGGVRYAVAGDNPGKKHEGGQQFKHGVYVVVGVFAFGLVLNVGGNILESIRF